MAMTKLFGSRLSPFVEKVARALQYKGVEFELVPVRSPGDFKSWNPQTGKMPVLELDGTRIYDSTLILRKLDERFPERALVSTNERMAARQHFLEDWSDESLYWYCMGLRWQEVNAPETVAQLLDDIQPPALLRPVLGPFLRRQISAQARAQGLARLPMDVLLGELSRRFDELLVWLGDGPYFFADELGVADLSIFGQLNLLKSGPTPQAEDLIAARPTLMEFYRRVDNATAPAVGGMSAQSHAA
jgi:glutathione S-transferase